MDYFNSALNNAREARNVAEAREPSEDAAQQDARLLRLTIARSATAIVHALLAVAIEVKKK